MFIDLPLLGRTHLDGSDVVGQPPLGEPLIGTAHVRHEPLAHVARLQ